MKKFFRQNSPPWSGIGTGAVLQEVEILEFVEERALTPQEGILPHSFLELGGLDDLLDLGATALDILDRHGLYYDIHNCSFPTKLKQTPGSHIAEEISNCHIPIPVCGRGVLRGQSTGT